MSGGLDDQIASDMLRMEMALIVYDNFRMRHTAENSVTFSKRYPEAVKYCMEIDRLRE